VGDGADFRGKSRCNQTHESTNHPGVRLNEKSFDCLKHTTRLKPSKAARIGESGQNVRIQLRRT